jgi:hypothetical protein
LEKDGLTELQATQRRLLHCIRMRQHCEQDVHLLGNFCWRFRECCAVVDQRLRFRARSIEYDQVVAVLLQVRRHTAPHYA